MYKMKMPTITSLELAVRCLAVDLETVDVPEPVEGSTVGAEIRNIKQDQSKLQINENKSAQLLLHSILRPLTFQIVTVYARFHRLL
jgi:hypothetical protein